MIELITIGAMLFASSSMPIYTVSATFSKPTDFVYSAGMVLDVPEYNNKYTKTLGYPGGCVGLCPIGEGKGRVDTFFALTSDNTAITDRLYTLQD